MAPDKNAASYGYPRPFQLDAFRIETPMHTATPLELFACTVNPRLRPLSDQMMRATSSRFWAGPGLHSFAPELPFQKLPAHLYLRSYFEAAGYAESLANELRKELQLRTDATGKNAETLEAIAASRCAVSVHVRRGDFIVAGSDHSQPMNYYEQLWKIVLEENADVDFFIFSDDMEYCRAHLPIEGRRHFVDHNGTGNAWEDMRLMSACRKHVITNSTFSWWGAWLDPRVDKEVLAPKYWRNTPDSYFPELFPAGWRAIDTLESTLVSA